VQGIEPERDRPPWAYTVGLTPHARPELLVTGLPLRQAARLLNSVAAHAMHAEAPVVGEQVPLVGGPLVEFVSVTHPDLHPERTCFVAAQRAGVGREDRG
jgi:hypothetical protein